MVGAFREGKGIHRSFQITRLAIPKKSVYLSYLSNPVLCVFPKKNVKEANPELAIYNNDNILGFSMVATTLINPNPLVYEKKNSQPNFRRVGCGRCREFIRQLLREK